MKLLNSFPLLSFTLVLVSIASLCVAQHSVELLLVAGVLAALSWYVTEGPRGRTLPRWVCNLLVVAACLNMVVDLLRNDADAMGVLGRFAVWLTLIKLYERRTARDHAQLLMLSLLLVIIGCLQSAEFLFGALLLIYAVLGLYVLMLYQLHAAFDASRLDRAATSPIASPLVPPLRPILGRRSTLHFRTLVGSLGVGGLVLSAALFVIFPRSFGEGAIGRLPAPTGTRQVGFTDEVDLLGGTRITDSRQLALTVRLEDAEGRPVTTDRPLLLRGAVLDRYEGLGVWVATEHSRFHLATEAGAWRGLGVAGVGESGTTVQRVRTHFRTDVAFGLSAPEAVSTETPDQLTYDPLHQTLRTDGSRLGTYAVRSLTAPTDEELASLAHHEPSRGHRRDRFRDARIRRRAVELLAEANLPAEAPVSEAARWRWHRDAARAFVRHLQSDAFAYTLDLSDVVTEMDGATQMDPIVQFLLVSRRGHCEYFASAMTALCHCVGIDARVVSGFLAQRVDESTDAYAVLASNAHAWVEVPTGPYRWTPYDPSPTAVVRDLHEVDTNFADRLRWFYQRFEGTWSSGVVQFDQTSQRSLVDSFNMDWSRRLTETLDAVRRWLQRVNQAFYFGPAGYVWMGIVALALVIAVIALVKLVRRSKAIRRRAGLRHVHGGELQRMLRQLGFYVDMLATLERAGYPKPQWQPPLDFAASLEPTRPGAARVVRRLTELFYAFRYGRARLTSKQMGTARALLEELPLALKERP